MAETLLDRIKRHEGFRPEPYLCPAGRCTVGYGCNLEAHAGRVAAVSQELARNVAAGLSRGKELVAALQGLEFRWTEAQASEVLAGQVAEAGRQVAERWPWASGLSEARQGVLVEMVFQMGAAGLAGFRNALVAAQAGDFSRAAAEMLDSKWARTDSPGRAAELADIMRNGGVA